MPEYRAPLADFEFLLHDWLNVSEHYAQIGKDDIDADLVNEIITQGARFAESEVAPINQIGDQQGCTLKDGKVTTAEGFPQAYQSYIENGWNAMLGSEEYGGQELPYSVAIPVHEMLVSANVSWRLVCGLTESAVLALEKHGSDELKETYLPNLISGEWTGTMNLTEPQAGSDLSLLTSKAEANDDGSYKISGTKIFISGGDHEWTDNIIHLVLARLPDAPAGVKGISLFLVPKMLPDANGEFTIENDLSVGSIEHKMGLHGCPTCVMNFDGAKGWLIGAPHSGLACMFTMMNDARFQVGLQGTGIAEASYQGALTYAKERLQSRAPQGVQQPDEKADAIIHLPDVRRMLLTQKALTEGSRALGLLYAKQVDIVRFGTEEEQAKAESIVAYLTPITKSFFTDMGQEVSQHGVQIFGGHGYIQEWGMEQLIRDSRITQLYEGTNGIQALDLISRKLVRDGGRMLQNTAALFSDMINAIQNEADKNMALEIQQQWLAGSESLMSGDAFDTASRAYDYMQFCAYSLLAICWLSMKDRAAQTGNDQLASSKAKTCDFYIKRLYPRALMHKAALGDSGEDLAALSLEDF
ncbi:acyl-CoA dehydrogenase family protein [Planctobacterium marinum]|uniref:3-methylmercaptopropionyl-CoA dehydrogenase n=1 Tax=Planctobacterium marinum TaxID=1631968 RepID=A0AA48HH91_9ALTE|nr:acyl-CoA dehydrogenase [Planctobacterium marinum]